MHARVVGNATVVHRPDRMSEQARALSLAVAADPHHELVVVDLPPDSPFSLWEAVAAVLPRGRRGIRLVLGGRSRETTSLAAQWLAERLGRSVVAPDGAVLTGARGGLFVHSGRGTGWIRFQAGKAPRWEGKRFPQPGWDAAVFADDWTTSSRGVAEPIPGGLWVHPVGFEARQRGYRARLIEHVPCQVDLIAIVVGCPGSPPLSLDDASRVWIRLTPAERERVRFIQFGPVELPPETAFGQALADFLGEPVACYTGMPIATSQGHDIVTVIDDGTLGWSTFARELGYLPRPVAGADSAPPELISHRQPVQGMVEVSPAVYWYAPDAVIEVVQSGLWIRPPNEGGNAGAVRAAGWDSTVHHLLFDAEPGGAGERMRVLAHDVLARLSPALRQASRVLPAHTLLAERRPLRVTGEAHAELGAARPAGEILIQPVPTALSVTPLRSLDTESARATETWLDERSETTSLTVSPTAADVPSADRPALAGSKAEPTEAVVRHNAQGSPISLRLDTGALSVSGAGPIDAPIALSPTLSDADSHALATPLLDAVESIHPAADVNMPPAKVRVDLGVPLVEPSSELHRDLSGVGRQMRAASPAALQATPEGAASALVPDRGIDEERGWLRRTLGSEFGIQANAVSRVLSEHPGFQGALTRGAADVLADAVAVRLHLSPHGEAIDLALRTAVVGSHIPFARCVVSGLGRLPSHRGPTVFAASPTPEQLALYRSRKLVTEWGFVHTLTAPCARQQGTTDVVIWSMTGRRTRLLEPGESRVEDRVLFMPGTSFKVLRITDGGGGRSTILLRELAGGEIGADGEVNTARASLDDMASASLDGQIERWAAAPPRERVEAAALGRFGALPGLR